MGEPVSNKGVYSMLLHTRKDLIVAAVGRVCVGVTGHVGHASVRGLEKARYTKSILKDLNLA